MLTRDSAWHPYLFALYPILLLFAANAHQVVLGEIFISILVVMMAVAIVTTGLNLIVKEIHKSSLIVTVGLIWFFSWGHILKLGTQSFLHNLDPLYPKYNINLTILACLSLGLVSYYLLRSPRSPIRLTRLANKVGLLLVVIQICSASWVLFNRQTIANESQSLSIVAGSDQKLPDIYYLLVDGYGRSDVLADMYNYDNRPFISHLRERGFYVAEQSNANYCQTLLSLTSTLNMNLLDQITTFDTSSNDRLGFKNLLDNNQVFEILRANGYKIAVFETGYDLIRLDEADITLGIWSHFSEFVGHLIQSTPLPFFVSSLESQYQTSRDRMEYILERLPAIPESDTPRFIFAHFLCPHPPFLYDSTGVFHELPTPYNMSDGSHYLGDTKTAEEYREDYSQQIKYFTKRLTRVIDEILDAHRDNPPVILVQADHGPGSELNWDSIEESNIYERMAILNAYYFPGVDYSTVFYPAITPANSFRVLLNEYMGADLPMVPDRSFFSEWERPFIFYDVTDEVTAPN